MEIKIVENIKETKCDVIIINKFEGKETTCELANKFLPEDFKGKKGEIFVLHTHREIPAEYILVLGLGKEEELDNNVIRESISKAIKKCNGLKAKTVTVDSIGICDAKSTSASFAEVTTWVIPYISLISRKTKPPKSLIVSTNPAIRTFLPTSSSVIESQ